MTAVYAWLGRHRVLVDSLLAGILGLVSVGSLIGQPPAAIPIVLLMIVPVAFRRRAPMAAFVIAVLAGAWQVLGLSVHTAGTQNAGPLPSDLALLVLLYTVAAYRPRRYSIPALLTCVGGSLIAVLVWSPITQVNVGERLFLSGFLFGGVSLACWILGDSMRYRRGYYAALEERAARLEAERHAEAKVAAAAERARIARELHDIVAHHVSVMVVQADGASYVLQSDPRRAANALAAVSATGRQALTELRRLLGVLRSDGEQAALAPLPGLGALRELLDQSRAAGLEVSYTLTGVPRELPEGAELAAYRVVQESLTNTRKHAGLAATSAVSLQYRPDGLVVAVTDDGVAAPTGEPGGHAWRYTAARSRRDRCRAAGSASAPGSRSGRHATEPTSRLANRPRIRPGRPTSQLTSRRRIKLARPTSQLTGRRPVLPARPTKPSRLPRAPRHDPA
jgi:signal transduction histidine kinase